MFLKSVASYRQGWKHWQHWTFEHFKKSVWSRGLLAATCSSTSQPQIKRQLRPRWRMLCSSSLQSTASTTPSTHETWERRPQGWCSACIPSTSQQIKVALQRCSALLVDEFWRDCRIALRYCDVNMVHDPFITDDYPRTCWCCKARFIIFYDGVCPKRLMRCYLCFAAFAGDAFKNEVYHRLPTADQPQILSKIWAWSISAFQSPLSTECNCEPRVKS